MPSHPLANLKSFLILLASFILLWFLYEITHLDLLLQDQLYNFQTCTWLVNRDNALLKKIFYDGIKWVLALFGVGALGIFINTFFNKRFLKLRYQAFYFFLCMALIPLTISSLKSVTNVYCPWDLERYGGKAPYVKVYSSYPEDFTQLGRKPQCFPGGHASGGFALFSLFFLASTRQKRILALLPPFLIGGIMGGYQMLKGAHFLGHNLTTALMSFLMAQGIYLLLHFILRKKGVEPRQA